MVKITNGKDAPIEVTRGAYEGAFKSLGYYPVDETKDAQDASDATTGHNNQQQSQEPDDLGKTDADDSDDEEGTVDEFAELEQKPIGQWTKQEVKDYAAAKSIDISGTKNANEAKEIIKEYLQAQE